MIALTRQGTNPIRVENLKNESAYGAYEVLELKKY